MTTTPAIVAEVTADIERVRATVTHLGHIDDVFWQTEAVIDRNHELHGGDMFRKWLGYCYADSIVIGLRRLVDDDRRTASLIQVLQKVKGRASDFRREWYVGMCAPFLRTEADGWFTEIIGGPHPRLPSQRVQAWQDYLKTALANVERFANEHVAHASLHSTGLPPTFQEVRVGLVAAFHTLQWLIRLTSAGVLTTPVPKIQTNWLLPFRVAWLAPEKPAPPYEHLDDLARSHEALHP